MNTQARAHLQSKPRQANVVSAPTGRNPAAMENRFSTSRARSKVACFGEGGTLAMGRNHCNSR
jgi:hypothetical protein